MHDRTAPSPPPATVTRATSAVPRRLQRYLTLDDFEPQARRILPKFLYGYISGGAETDAARADNRKAFEEYGFVPRVLQDVSGRDQTTTLFGKSYASPFGIPPMGSSALCAYRGDIVLTRAAAAANIPMILSASSLITLEDVRANNPDAWYQAYLAGVDERIEPLVDRVAAAGYDTFVVTADVPVPPNRENNIRNGFQVPLSITPRVFWDTISHPDWLLNTWARTVFNHGMPHFENMDAKQGPPVLSKNLMRNIGNRDQLAWKHVALIRKRWPGKLVVKGLISPEDARLAREHGCDGVLVSNHGGRQLDYTFSGLRTLPEIAAQKGNMTVMVDGGIRRGTDVIKALALGADFVWVGRPFLYAAVAAGEAGVTRAISLLQAEIDRDLALSGIRSLKEITPELVRKF
ncbi:alpha-hydroxy-acid oxidizing protein [Bradyrhizobium genosp. L]|uniref:alpha-hydroxy acid oxidase n=1 Tax=Bradyrhizobium genosp. L TaxID=83637 RepID=UPI0018A2C8BC|nr:alpha-hydroxy acid oxidase [Bradyrhizobium genosp. L]QPF83701.1 alpha-hydroxy-acid oxidizing protein [Bradyrhizobium genosp. L]